jgi:DNA-binding HxlR family transcriptional regulator
LEVLGERWTFLILREALAGRTRFLEFQDALGVSPDVLTDRLSTLVDAGVMRRRRYQLAGDRARFSYHLTPAGQELRVVIGALQQWGDVHRPRSAGPSSERRNRKTGQKLSVAFVDESGREVPLRDTAFVLTEPSGSGRGS